MARGQFLSIEVDAKSVIAKYDRLTEDVRAQLRAVLPSLMRSVQGGVRDQIARNFKTWVHLGPAISAKMIENPTSIYGQIWVDPADFSAVAAASLERGARPHVIEAKNASALYFFWEKLGMNVAFRRVNHPGYVGKSYMAATLSNMREEIQETLTKAVLAGAEQ